MVEKRHKVAYVGGVGISREDHGETELSNPPEGRNAQPLTGVRSTYII